jgi:hypothetical protein
MHIDLGLSDNDNTTSGWFVLEQASYRDAPVILGHLLNLGYKTRQTILEIVSDVEQSIPPHDILLDVIVTHKQEDHDKTKHKCIPFLPVDADTCPHLWCYIRPRAPWIIIVLSPDNTMIKINKTDLQCHDRDKDMFRFYVNMENPHLMKILVHDRNVIGDLYPRR